MTGGAITEGDSFNQETPLRAVLAKEFPTVHVCGVKVNQYYNQTLMNSMTPAITVTSAGYRMDNAASAANKLSML